MKYKIKIAISCIMTLGLTVTLLWQSTNLLERKESDVKNSSFFAQEEDFDVLFLGTSHMGYGIYPMELWNDYGIVSYNLGGHGNPLATTYWTMENAFDYTTPKLVVIDCYLLSCMVKTNSSVSSVHLSFDAFPISKNKTAATWDLLDDTEAESMAELREPRSRMEVIWDYVIYHDRWNDLREDDFAIELSIEKGAEHYAAVVPVEEIARIPAGSKMEEDTVSVQYLEKMIKDCNNREIDVLLTYFPFAADEICQKEANKVYDIAEQYGVDYINFLDLDVVNYKTDFCDTDYHLNPSGARKVTDYTGRYIMEHYDIPDQRNNAAYGNWYSDYEEYVKYKEDNLRSLESLDKYLMMLADKNYCAVIETGNTKFLDDEYYLNLLENLQTDVTVKQDLNDDIRISVFNKETMENVDQSCFAYHGRFSK